MRALVLGASGAVGRVATAELRRSGHDVTPASRSTTRGLAIDIRSQSGLRSLEIAMAGHDVLVNASGIESPALARFDALVEVSATAAYLDDLGHRIAPSARAVLGAGLAPGLSTLMISALTTRPGDEIDLGVLLGTGEHHGAAATAWTSALVGTQVHCPPDHGVAWNFREHRHLAGPGGERRRHLRADFPDHVLIGRERCRAVSRHRHRDCLGGRTPGRDGYAGCSLDGRTRDALRSPRSHRRWGETARMRGATQTA